MRDPRQRVLLLAGGALVAAALMLGVLVFGFGARLDAPTIALAAVAAALVYALGQLYAMVWALSRPDRVAQVGQALGSFTQAELRDEKRRLLRAIKELEFDHGMGKLSQGDFDAVIATYRLRAIEVMRALEGGATIHPELARLLAEREGKGQSEGKPAEVVPDSPASVVVTPSAQSEREAAEAAGLIRVARDTTRACAACGASNDADARFCKLCGAKQEVGEARPLQAPVSGEIGGGP